MQKTAALFLVLLASVCSPLDAVYKQFIEAGKKQKDILFH